MSASHLIRDVKLKWCNWAYPLKLSHYNLSSARDMSTYSDNTLGYLAGSMIIIARKCVDLLLLRLLLYVRPLLILQIIIQVIQVKAIHKGLKSQRSTFYSSVPCSYGNQGRSVPPCYLFPTIFGGG